MGSVKSVSRVSRVSSVSSVSSVSNVSSVSSVSSVINVISVCSLWDGATSVWWYFQHLRSVRRVADPGVVVEEDANTAVAELEAEAVLVAVVDPLRDEHRALLARQHARLLPWRHHHQGRGDRLVQRRRPCSRSRLLVRRGVDDVVVVVGVVVLVLLSGQGEGEDGGGERGDVRQRVGRVVGRVGAAGRGEVGGEQPGREEEILRSRF